MDWQLPDSRPRRLTEALGTGAETDPAGRNPIAGATESMANPPNNTEAPHARHLLPYGKYLITTTSAPSASDVTNVAR